jgi:glycine/D-amino acid oxidase-like deaminating enzyme
MRKRLIVAAVAGVAVVGAGGAAVAGGAFDDTDTPIDGPALAHAERAALAETGGGTVTGTEVDDEESKYEVEVTLDNGQQVDVQLDEDFQVVGADPDHEEQGPDD